jgi:hypothetical protein
MRVAARAAATARFSDEAFARGFVETVGAALRHAG